ncbi:hypothetical protein [Vibrio harveyi]|uniref:hypothetical protein n=1 Tax=Vibrio harveyi TaxID=669 RepID=UPI0025B03930|nr:hypothetical protein [Vibrio harveyi]WJT07817.1 hypothetical protein PH545_03555 [Vibrio harveyi]
MGNYAYDYLNESLLLDETLINCHYKGISDTVLEKKLLNYREYCLKILPDIRKNVKTNKEIIRCMATDSMSHISHLKRAALYLEEAVVADPIFELTDFRTLATEALASLIDMKSTPKIDRQKLANAATKLIELRPLVVGNYIKLYPVSFELERGTEIPILYSDVGFEDCLPPNILKQYKSKADVRRVENDNGRLLVMRDLTLCRHISVMFQGMEEGYSMSYILLPTEFEPTNKEGLYRVIHEKPPSEPPTRTEFIAWANQSINQSARAHFIDLNKRIALCDSLECLFATEHPFESDLLNMNINVSDISTNALNCTLQMDVPFLEQVSSADLMSLRNNDGEAFQSFRAELEKGFREARYESDPNKVRSIIEDTQHELFDVQMRQIAPQVKHLQKTHFTDASIALAGLGLSVVTGGASLLATGIALAHGYKSHHDYKSKVTANPCHFLWNVKQKAR